VQPALHAICIETYPAILLDSSSDQERGSHLVCRLAQQPEQQDIT